MITKPNWYILYAQPGSELRVTRGLRRNKYHCYCFLTDCKKEPFGTNSFRRPVFPGFVFIYVPESELNVVKRLNGVLNPLYYFNKPLILPDEDMHMLIDFINSRSHLRLIKTDVDIKRRVGLEVVHGHSHNNIDGKAASDQLCLFSLGYLLEGDVATSIQIKNVISFEKEPGLKALSLRL